METRIDILNELKMLSPMLASLEKVNVFTVPDGYFEHFSDAVSGMLKKEAPALLKELPREHPLRAPEGYFDGLAGSILNRIKARQGDHAGDELKQLSPMLYSIQGEKIYEVPRGYFETLPDVILSKVRPGKLVAMRKRSSIWVRYAVAAAFTGMITLGVFKYINPGAEKGSQPSYVTAGLQLRDKNVDDELAKVSDDDIIKYLESNNEDFDAQTVASKTLDQNDLPSQTDYLLDDKTLDKYLDNIKPDDLKN